MKLAIALLLAFAPFLSAQSDTPPQPVEKWEHCIIRGGTYVDDGSQVRLIANVAYAAEKGFRKENVELLVSNPTGQKRDFSWQIPEAIAKALAQLGAQGWELVSVLPSGVDQLNNNLGYNSYYLKRRLR